MFEKGVQYDNYQAFVLSRECERLYLCDRRYELQRRHSGEMLEI